jgi:hypothetical protein
LKNTAVKRTLTLQIGTKPLHLIRRNIKFQRARATGSRVPQVDSIKVSKGELKLIERPAPLS